MVCRPMCALFNPESLLDRAVKGLKKTALIQIANACFIMTTDQREWNSDFRKLQAVSFSWTEFLE